MNILSQLAYRYNPNDYGYGRYNMPAEEVAPGVAAAILISSILFSVILAVVIYVVSAIFLSKLFKKAGVDGWIAWVPFYNSWKLLEIGGQQGFWAVLAIIPVVNIVSAVFMYIAMYHIGKKLGKDDVFILLAIFLPIVWLIWLAMDNSKWDEKASTAKSLHKPAHK